MLIIIQNAEQKSKETLTFLGVCSRIGVPLTIIQYFGLLAVFHYLVTEIITKPGTVRWLILLLVTAILFTVDDLYF